MRFAKMLLGAGLAAALAAGACAPVDGPAPPADEGPKDDLRRAVPTPDGARERIEAAVSNIRKRPLLTKHAFWTVFHAILGLGPGVELEQPQLKVKVNALDHICEGGELEGLRFILTRHGAEVETLANGVGQGHTDQFIAEMAQWGMPKDRKMVVLGEDRTFFDFVKQSQMRARINAKMELSWTILVVAQYIGTEGVTWTNAHGEKLAYEDLIRYELAEPVETAACGGTHRLFGLTWAYHLHLRNGGKTEGVWQGVAGHTRKYRDIARKGQNPDGALSTGFFRDWGNDPNKGARINTTGHMLEWLALALSDEELREPWVAKAADALATLILELRDEPIDSGPLYHAAHALQIYHARIYGGDFTPKELLVPLPPGWGAKKK